MSGKSQALVLPAGMQNHGASCFISRRWYLSVLFSLQGVMSSLRGTKRKAHTTWFCLFPKQKKKKNHTKRTLDSQTLLNSCLACKLPKNPTQREIRNSIFTAHLWITIICVGKTEQSVFCSSRCYCRLLETPSLKSITCLSTGIFSTSLYSH